MRPARPITCKGNRDASGKLSVRNGPLRNRRRARAQIVRVRIGTLDSYLKTKPHAHIFFADRAEWYEFEDDVAKYAERPH